MSSSLMANCGLVISPGITAILSSASGRSCLSQSNTWGGEREEGSEGKGEREEDSEGKGDSEGVGDSEGGGNSEREGRTVRGEWDSEAKVEWDNQMANST